MKMVEMDDTLFKTIIIIVASVFLVIILIITLACCFKRKLKKRNFLSKVNASDKKVYVLNKLEEIKVPMPPTFCFHNIGNEIDSRNHSRRKSFVEPSFVETEIRRNDVKRKSFVEPLSGSIGNIDKRQNDVKGKTFLELPRL